MMEVAIAFLSVLTITLTSIILYGKKAEESGRKAAVIDIRKVQNRREKVAKVIESETFRTDSNSVAESWRKLS
jgi:hypothetical protein